MEKGSTSRLVERGWQESEAECGKRDREGRRRRERKRDSKQVFSCAMHNEERQTAHKGPTNEARVIHIHSGLWIRVANVHARKKGAKDFHPHLGCTLLTPPRFLSAQTS